MDKKVESKTVGYSRTVMSRIMLPSEANPAGNVHGGEIMKFMDTTAFVAAVKHCRTNVVTARVDELEFYLPILVGQLVTCRARLVFVGKSSMEVAVQVQVEDLKSINLLRPLLLPTLPWWHWMIIVTLVGFPG